MNKKVLLLPSWYPNHSNENGSYFREQASFLAQSGYDIKVLIVKELHTKNAPLYRLRQKLKFGRFSLSQYLLQQSPDAFSYPVVIQKDWSHKKKLIETDKAYLKAFKLLVKQLNWFPDLLHIQGMFKLGFSSLVIAESYNLPLVVIEHSPFKFHKYLPIHQERIRKIFVRASKLAGVSHSHKASLATIGAKREIEVVWNLMDELKFNDITSSKSVDLFVITTILTASSIKDPITFFDAILQFMESYDGTKPVEVHVLGMSSLKDLTKMKGIDEDLISKYYKLNHILKFRSRLGRDDIVKFHRISSVYISTSTEETYNVSIREAILCGTPVISTKSGGPEDILINNKELLVDTGDVEGLAKKLLQIYENRLKCNLEELRALVISQSGRQAFLNRMENFYDI